MWQGRLATLRSLSGQMHSLSLKTSKSLPVPLIKSPPAPDDVAHLCVLQGREATGGLFRGAKGPIGQAHRQAQMTTIDETDKHGGCFIIRAIERQQDELLFASFEK